MAKNPFPAEIFRKEPCLSFNREAKLISCESICEAMLLLLQNKKFAEITITEIAEKAGVSRNAIYRNFADKEQIAAKLLEKVTDEFKNDILAGGASDYRDYLVTLFTHLKKYSGIVKIFDKAGLDFLVRREFTEWRFYPQYSPEDSQYASYARVYRNSALFETYMHWLRSGERETPEEIADIILRICDEMCKSKT